MTRTRISTLVAGASTARWPCSQQGRRRPTASSTRRQSNIWIANPDGSGQYQVTTDGTGSRPYNDPSQADDGTIVAGQGQEIVRMRQNGQVLARFNPPATTDSAGQPIDGVPQDLSVSPDGSKVAFSYYQYGCPVGASCGARTVLLYSSTSAATPVSQYGKHYRRNASWVSNDRILAFGGYQSQVNVGSPGPGDDDDQHWFDDEDIHQPPTDLGDGELSRQGDRLVALRNYGSDLHLQFYAVSDNVQSGAPPGPPTEACNSGADSSLDSPTWSHDGRTVAYAVAAGIETLPLPSVTPGYCNGAGSSRLAIPGGAEPDFGPAGVNPGAATGRRRHRADRQREVTRAASGSRAPSATAACARRRWPSARPSAPSPSASGAWSRPSAPTRSRPAPASPSPSARSACARPSGVTADHRIPTTPPRRPTDDPHHHDRNLPSPPRSSRWPARLRHRGQAAPVTGPEDRLFRCTVDGVQTTTWKTDHKGTGGCDQDAMRQRHRARALQLTSDDSQARCRCPACPLPVPDLHRGQSWTPSQAARQGDPSGRAGRRPGRRVRRHGRRRRSRATAGPSPSAASASR